MHDFKKNNIPWTGLMKFPNPVNPDILSDLKKLWHKQDWGHYYENNRRGKEQVSIYDSTRVVSCYPNIKPKSKEFRILATRVCRDLQPYFDFEITFWVAELVLLIPRGVVPLHYDGLELCRRASRIIVPLTENTDEISYSFCSWTHDAPVNDSSFISEKYFDYTDLYTTKMTPGHYHFFNHRVPHSTRSVSNKPRATFSIDILPKKDYLEYMASQPANMFAGVTELEKTRIIQVHG